jgi:hypothetical protein
MPRLGRRSADWAVLGGLVLLALGAARSAARPPAEPARIQIAVTPTAVVPGSRAEVKVDLTATPGVKINRYPKIKLVIDPRPGIARGGDVSAGNDAPPKVDDANANYFASPIEPLKLQIAVDEKATRGRHELEGTLTYFYCVTESGFCAPFRAPVKIPIEVR